MTTTTLHTPTGLVTHDLEGHDNVYAKETPMEMVGPDAGWGFHERAEKLNGRRRCSALLLPSLQSSSAAKGCSIPSVSEPDQTDSGINSVTFGIGSGFPSAMSRARR